jgi:hypothetical protein
MRWANQAYYDEGKGDLWEVCGMPYRRGWKFWWDQPDRKIIQDDEQAKFLQRIHEVEEETPEDRARRIERIARSQSPHWWIRVLP